MKMMYYRRYPLIAKTHIFAVRNALEIANSFAGSGLFRGAEPAFISVRLANF